MIKNCTLIIVLLASMTAQAQIIRGVIKDKDTKEGLFGINVIEKGTTNGTSSDFDGQFQLKLTKGLPAQIDISGLGYIKRTVTVNQAKDIVTILLEADQVQLEEMQVTDTRITEKQKEAPLTVESMDAIAIRQTASASFYDGLGALKGVDLTSASIGFKIINTRGFNSTSPVRSLQLIDGVDNQSPGLNFSLGNFLGASELDIQKVDLIQGASSAFYGPGAFNGVIAMQTKSPFDFPGLSVMLKGGERNLFEGAIRVAEKFKDKKGYDRFAIKFNFCYLRADDWEARNYNASTDSKVGVENPGGYDAVNVYGDEALANGYDFYTDLSLRKDRPGLGFFYRDGYKEEDLVDYNTENLKSSLSLHYMTRKKIEFTARSSFGYGTTVYQGENRYSLRDISFHQNMIEVSKKDKFFIRAYATHENAGDTYDAVVTAFLLQNNNKPQGSGIKNWNNDYLSYWENNISFQNNGRLFDAFQTLYGYPFQSSATSVNNYDFALAASMLAMLSDSLSVWHQEARDYANTMTHGSLFRPYFAPGTYEFDTAFAGITSRPLGQGGSRLIDQSALYHVHGEYKFRFKPAKEKDKPTGWTKFTQGFSTVDFTVGANFRIYTPDTKGTIFADTGGVKITNWEMGAYLGFEKRWEKVKINGTVRIDKNQNFPVLFSPAFSLVHTPHKNHTIRYNLSSGVRNPTLADQYLFYNVGRATLRGNITGYDSLITVASFQEYMNYLDPSVLRYINSGNDSSTIDPVRPERVYSAEIGYRGIISNKVYIDGSYYFSLYQDFIGYKVGIDGDFDIIGFPTNKTKVYRIATNAIETVYTMGFSTQVSYYFAKYFTLSGNYTWNRLFRTGQDPIIPAFNTPEHKFNISIDGRDIQMKIGKAKINNWGFNVNFKWIQGFIFEGSPQFTGEVPSYYLLDAQLSYTIKKAHLTFKLGAQNITDNQVFQVYGGPRVGRMVYGSVLFDWNFK